VTETKIAWGVLGTGNIARQFSDGLGACRRGFPAAVGSRNAGTAAEFGARFGFAARYAGYEPVLADPSVDAVYVSLPNSMHCEWTLRALDAGKHVLCEKPIASNESEARRMFDAARAAGKLLVEGFMYRAHPQTREVLTRIRGGEIGEVKLIRTSFCYKANRTDGNVRFDPVLSGGALMDVGCYCVDFSRLIAGSHPDEIQATAVMHGGGVDELAAGTLKFPNGVVASFTCGIRVHGDNTAHICGSEAYVEMPWPWKPKPEGVNYRIKASMPPKQDGAILAVPPAREFTITAGMNIFALEADDVAASILDGKPPLISEAESIGNTRVLDEIRRQISTQK